MFEEKKISREMIYTGRIISVHKDKVELPNAQTSFREVVKLANAVAIVAVTETLEVLLVKQYRYPVGKQLWEIPAGKIENNEHPLDCARRELEEETGYVASNWRQLTTFYTSPGFCDEKMYLFLADGLTPGQTKPDPDEFITTIKVPLAAVMTMLQDGTIQDAKTVAGLLAAAKYTRGQGD